MTYKSLWTIVFIASVFFFSSNTVFSQTTGGGSQTTDVIQSQPDVPNYSIYPQVDLNPYGLSSMEKSGVTDRDAVGTLGTNVERPSNLEINRPREKTEGAEKADITGEEKPGSIPQAVVDTQSSVGTSPSLPTGRSGKFYTWTDDQGVSHFTNELGSVPPEYQEQAVKGRSGEQ